MNIAVIGISTGGPAALREYFREMPSLDCCVLLVQHMPWFINESVRRSIAAQTPMDVRLARSGDRLEHGVVYVAPSEVHMGIQNNRRIQLLRGEKVNYVCPSADVTMKSLKKYNGDRFLAVVMTGLGRDGADGAAYLKTLGATVLAQDEASSTIYGMPKATAETGCVDHQGTPSRLRGKTIELFSAIARAT